MAIRRRCGKDDMEWGATELAMALQTAQQGVRERLQRAAGDGPGGVSAGCDEVCGGLREAHVYAKGAERHAEPV